MRRLFTVVLRCARCLKQTTHTHLGAKAQCQTCFAMRMAEETPRT